MSGLGPTANDRVPSNGGSGANRRLPATHVEPISGAPVETEPTSDLSAVVNALLKEYRNANKKAIRVHPESAPRLTKNPMRPCTVMYNDAMLGALGVVPENKDIVKEYLLSLGVRCTRVNAKKEGLQAHRASDNMSRLNIEIIRYLYLLQQNGADLRLGLESMYRKLWAKLAESSGFHSKAATLSEDKKVYVELKRDHYIEEKVFTEATYKSPRFIKAFCALRSCFVERSHDQFSWEYGPLRLARFIQSLYDESVQGVELPSECGNLVARMRQADKNQKVNKLRKNLSPELVEADFLNLPPNAKP